MHTDVLDAVLHGQLIGLVGDLLVVHAPGVLALVLVGVVANRIALDGVGLHSERVLEMLEPTRLPRREDSVRHHALGAGLLVHPLARGNRHFVGQEPVLRHVGRRARDQRDLGVAIEEDFLEVVVPLQVLDGLRLVDQRGVPARLAHRLALAHECLDARVVAQEMRVHVHDELVFQRIRPLLCHGRRRCFRLVDIEDRAERVVHGDEGGRHAGGALKEGAAAQALFLAELIAHVEQARFHLPLLFALGCRDVFVARDDLRRDRRGVRQHLGRHQRRQFLRGQKAHRFLLGDGVRPLALALAVADYSPTSARGV